MSGTSTMSGTYTMSGISFVSGTSTQSSKSLRSSKDFSLKASRSSYVKAADLTPDVFGRDSHHRAEPDWHIFHSFLRSIS